MRLENQMRKGENPVQKVLRHGVNGYDKKSSNVWECIMKRVILNT